MLPPRISNTGMGGPRPVILRERENLQLTCATSGDPKPTVTWSRRDGWAVIDGPHKRGKKKYLLCSDCLTNNAQSAEIWLKQSQESKKMKALENRQTNLSIS